MDRDELQRYFEHVLDRNEYYDWLGLRPTTVEPGRVVGEIPFADRLAPPSPPGPAGIHGGVIATLVDISAIGAVVSLLATPRDAFVSTTGLAVDFVESVQTDVRADAEVTDVDAKTAHVSVEVFPAEPEDPDPVATGEVTCRVSERNAFVDRDE